jgi:hypothetical protein
MTIINLRGTNGSGKSTIVSQVLVKFPYKAVYGILGPRRPEAYRLTLCSRSDSSCIRPLPDPGRGRGLYPALREHPSADREVCSTGPCDV